MCSVGFRVRPASRGMQENDQAIFPNLTGAHSHSPRASGEPAPNAPGAPNASNALKDYSSPSRVLELVACKARTSSASCDPFHVSARPHASTSIAPLAVFLPDPVFWHTTRQPASFLASRSLRLAACGAPGLGHLRRDARTGHVHVRAHGPRSRVHGAGFTEQGLRSGVYNSRPIVYENQGAKVCAKFECWALAPLRFQADDG